MSAPRVSDEDFALAVELIEAGNMAESSPDSVLCAIVLDLRDARAENARLRGIVDAQITTPEEKMVAEYSREVARLRERLKAADAVRDRLAAQFRCACCGQPMRRDGHAYGCALAAYDAAAAKERAGADR